MMKAFSLLSIFLFVFGHKALSQFPYSVDLVGSVEYSYRNLVVSDDLTNVNTDILERNLSLREGETNKRNFRFGFNFNKYIDNNFHFKTGLRYASVGYNGQKQTDIRWPSEVGEDGTYNPNPLLPHENQFIYDYRYIAIPAIFRYHITNGRLVPFIEAGLALHIYAHTIRQTINEFGTSKERFNNGEANADFSTVGSFSIGFEYLLDYDYALFYQGVGRYHLSPRQRGVINEYLFNYGVELGLRKRFGKKRISRT